MQVLALVGRRGGVNVNIDMILLANIGDVIGGIILILFIVLLVGGVIIGEISTNKHQKKRFNGGKCPNCNIELRFKDQQGSQIIYQCPKCMYSAYVDANSNRDRRYCDIFDYCPHLYECEKCTSKQCKYYRDKQKENKIKKIPPKKISEDGWPGLT